MSKLLRSFLSCFLIYSCCWAQGEDNVWIFGDSLGLDFNGTNPVLINSHINSKQYGSASISDANGQLLFYSNSKNVWDRNHNLMPNGNIDRDTIAPIYDGAVSIRQKAIIIPVPGKPLKYYLFTLGYTIRSYTFKSRLYYSVIDMSLNGGLGDVVPGQKCILIDSFNSGLTVTKGENCNFWLLARKNGAYYAFEITDEGVNTTPVISSFPPSTLAYANTGEYGEFIIKFSPDGTKVAANGGLGLASLMTIELYAFNKHTGQVYSQKLLRTTEYFGVDDIEFSPDASKLYVIFSDLQPRVAQYDISLPSLNAINSSVTTIVSGGFFSRWIALKVANNGKVYTTGETNPPTRGLRGIYEITQPNLAGTACGYNPIPVVQPLSLFFGFSSETFWLKYDTITTSTDTFICIPNNHFPDVTLNAPAGYRNYIWDNDLEDTIRAVNAPGTYWVSYKEGCTTITDTIIVRGKDISFSLGNDTVLCRTDSFELNIPFPDVAVQWQDFSTAHQYTVKRSGKYWVTLTQEGCSAADTITIEIKNIAQYLGNDTAICHDIPFQLQLNAKATPDATVQWSNGSHDNTLQVTSPGQYWVTVSDFPCLESDTISIGTVYCGCNFIVPNAFSPNGDGINDHFLPAIESGCPVSDYALNIYNRFGERVFSSSAPGMGWDGMYKGRSVEIGTYFYELRFKGGSDGIDNYRKGDLVLLR